MRGLWPLVKTAAGVGILVGLVVRLGAQAFVDGLAAIGDTDMELRVRLLARLGGAIRDEPSPDRRLALTAEAVELARRSDDPTALTFALDGRVAAMFAPDRVDECLALSDELCAAAERAGPASRCNGRGRRMQRTMPDPSRA